MEEADSEEKLIFCSAVIHQQPNLSYYSMYTRLLQEVFTLQAKVVQQWV